MELRTRLREALSRSYEGKFRPFLRTSISQDAETGTFVEESQIAPFRDLGMATIARGEVAMVILAGGLSTRVGSLEPKSILPVTAVRKKTLLQLHLEKLANLFESLALETHPLVFILTCSFNQTQIGSFLSNNSHFGLDPARVLLLVQKNLPCFLGEELEYSTYPSSQLSTPESELTDLSQRADLDYFYTRGFRLDSEYEGLVTSPNGNGNLFESLHKSEEFMRVLPQLKCLHVIGVDNCLSKPLDPEFLGFAAHMHTADMVNKCVARNKGENLGVFCVGDTPKVIEYSELDRLSENGLSDVDFYGNICDHIFSGSFIQRVMSESLYLKMPFHAAKKRIPYWSADDKRFVFPDSPNGYKLELFVFDVVEFASKVMCVVVDRDSNFAPLKTTWDYDLANVDAIQYRMDRVFKAWLDRVNCSVDGMCELSPKLSYSGENLESLRDKHLKGPVYLE